MLALPPPGFAYNCHKVPLPATKFRQTADLRNFVAVIGMFWQIRGLVGPGAL